MTAWDRKVPDHAADYGVQVRLKEFELHRARQWGACWLGCELYEQLGLDEFWAGRLPDSREGTCWRHILQTLVCYRLIDPGSEWRLHRQWFEQSAMGDLLGDLGPHDAMILRSHGLLTCGATIQQAFNTMYQLEMSCRAQVDAMAARTELVQPSAQILARTAHLYQPGTRRPYGVLEWPAMLRLLAAEGSGSGYPPYCQ